MINNPTTSVSKSLEDARFAPKHPRTLAVLVGMDIFTGPNNLVGEYPRGRKIKRVWLSSPTILDSGMMRC
ncbi:hypothetical protein VTO73DRAFT_12491 [Trametes versicolor]